MTGWRHRLRADDAGSALVVMARRSHALSYPPPCGESRPTKRAGRSRAGWGSLILWSAHQTNIYPHPDRLRFASAIDPPHKGESGGEAVRVARYSSYECPDRSPV